MKWITRENVKVDRVACPWLITKFVDPAAEFLFVPADQVMAVAERQGATPAGTSAGTEPDAEVPPAVVALLHADGIDVTDYRPRRVTVEELAAAHRIITLDCDLSDLARPGMVIERWDDVPPPSQNLPGARDRIRDHVEHLVVTIKHTELRAPDIT